MDISHLSTNAPASTPQPITAVRQVPPIGEQNPGPASQPVLYSSLLGSIQGGDLPALPADLDLPLFSACDAPTLLKVGRVSTTCEQAVKGFLAQAGEPHGIQNEIRRMRFIHTQNQLRRKDREFVDSIDIFDSIQDPNQAIFEQSPSDRTLTDLSAIIAEKKLSYIYLPLGDFSPQAWVKLTQAVCDAGPLKSLALDLCELSTDKFGDHAGAVLKIAQNGVSDGELTVLLGEKLSAGDAEKLLNQLRWMPGNQALAFFKTPKHPTTLAVICAGLSQTRVREISFKCSLDLQQNDLFALLLASPNLKHLSLNNVGMNEEKTLALAEALTVNRRLEKLTLWIDDYNDTEAICLFDAIAGHPSLCSLDMNTHKLRDMAGELCSHLRKKPDFSDLDFPASLPPPGASLPHLLSALSD